MDIVRLSIPYEFIVSRIQLGWQDILFGLRAELLDPGAATAFAAAQLAREEGVADSALIDLAGLGPSDSPLPFVEKLASEVPGGCQDAEDRWLCLALAWIREHKDEYTDPLQALEEVYADFGYPERIRHLIRYMPSEQSGSLVGRELSEGRLYTLWEEYVQDCCGLYARSPI